MCHPRSHSGNIVHRAYNSLQRLSSVSVSSVVNYQYDSASRLDTVTSGANTATYAYVPNSPLVSIVTFRNGGQTKGSDKRGQAADIDVA
jgi:hypothetical protein